MWVYTLIKLWKSTNRSQLDLSLLMLTGFHYQLSPFQITDTSLYSNQMTHKSEEVLNEPPQNVSLWLGILRWGQLLRQKVPIMLALALHTVAQSCLTLWPHGLQLTRLLCPWGFSRQDYWSGLPCLPPRDLPNPGIKPRSPTLQADSLPAELPGKPHVSLSSTLIHSIHSIYRSLFSFCFWLNCPLKTTAL